MRVGAKADGPDDEQARVQHSKWSEQRNADMQCGYCEQEESVGVFIKS